jgi:hypothetical protein
MYDQHEEKRAWVREQMKGAVIPRVISGEVEKLLETWWAQTHTEKSANMVLDSFARLARGQALDVATAEPEVWIAVKPGNIVRGEFIRVKSDAYEGEPGLLHNGRRGRVVRISNGDVITIYDDGRTPSFQQGVHHSPHVLEKRI